MADFKHQLRDQRQWQNKLAYGLIYDGDSSECGKWLGYARAKLAQLLQTSETTACQTFFPAQGIEIQVHCRPGMIRIKAAINGHIVTADFTGYGNPADYGMVNPGAHFSYTPQTWDKCPMRIWDGLEFKVKKPLPVGEDGWWQGDNGVISWSGPYLFYKGHAVNLDPDDTRNLNIQSAAIGRVAVDIGTANERTINAALIFYRRLYAIKQPDDSYRQHYQLVIGVHALDKTQDVFVSTTPLFGYEIHDHDSTDNPIYDERFLDSAPQFSRNGKTLVTVYPDADHHAVFLKARFLPDGTIAVDETLLGMPIDDFVCGRLDKSDYAFLSAPPVSLSANGSGQLVLSERRINLDTFALSVPVVWETLPVSSSVTVNSSVVLDGAGDPVTVGSRQDVSTFTGIVVDVYEPEVKLAVYTITTSQSETETTFDVDRNYQQTGTSTSTLQYKYGYGRGQVIADQTLTDTINETDQGPAHQDWFVLSGITLNGAQQSFGNYALSGTQAIFRLSQANRTGFDSEDISRLFNWRNGNVTELIYTPTTAAGNDAINYFPISLTD